MYLDPTAKLTTGRQGSHQVRERFGLVGEVGVHLDANVEVPFEPPPESGPVGGPETRLLVPAQHLDVAELLAQPLRDLGGAVGTSIIDYQDRGGRQRVPDPSQYPVDVG